MNYNFDFKQGAKKPLKSKGKGGRAKVSRASRSDGVKYRRKRAQSKVTNERRSDNKGQEGVRLRAWFIVFIVMIGFFSMGAKLMWVGLIAPDAEPSSPYAVAVYDMPLRGNIYDRNGILLATSLEVSSLYADPKMLLDINEVLVGLKVVFPNLNSFRLRKKLESKKRRFVWIKRKLTPFEVRKINDMGIPGLAFREEVSRVYPHQNLASHILGGVNLDGKGVAGIEKAYDNQLSRGLDITLALDVFMQQQLRKSLQDNMERTEAKGTWGISMSADKGEVLAMVKLPDYDPNIYGQEKPKLKFNNLTYGNYEMGSTFKIFTVAQALEDGVVTEDTQFNVEGPIKVGKYKIGDYHTSKPVMTVKEIITRSSNVGTARIVDEFASGVQRKFFKKLNLLDRLDIDWNELSTPSYPQRKWGRVHAMNMSFGHGIAVTPLHLVSAVTAIIGDGYYRAPAMVVDELRETPHKVISNDTVISMRGLLENVVKEGTGMRAKMAGYSLGGKTGTAEKSGVGGYIKDKNLASFVGIFPANNPQIVTLIMVDEARRGIDTGGRAAAPAFKSFVKKIAPMLAVAPKLEKNTLLSLLGESREKSFTGLKKKTIKLSNPNLDKKGKVTGGDVINLKPKNSVTGEFKSGEPVVEKREGLDVAFRALEASINGL